MFAAVKIARTTTMYVAAYVAYFVCLVCKNAVFNYDLQRNDSMERAVRKSPKKISVT
jgi:hypothetical protein